MHDIILIGGGGHALSVADSINAKGDYLIAGYTDANDMNNGLTYLGTDEALTDLYNNGKCYAAVGVGYLGHSDTRDKVFELLKETGFVLPLMVDSSAVVSHLVTFGEGTFVGKGALINAHTSIGKMCIINTGAIIEHSNIIGDFTHIAVGTVLCGDVTVGEHTLVGANATVLQGVKIGKNCVIGAGSTVLSDVPDNTRVIGVWG